MFPGETDFLFICNQDHLDNPDAVRATLERYCPTGRVVGIPSHKLGPVHAVRLVEHLIRDDSPVVVNYCDFTCYWDWPQFVRFTSETGCAGAIPAYKGFHPHTLGSTNYAYMREQDGWVLDIQENSHTRRTAWRSSLQRYLLFRNGALMKRAFKETVDLQLHVNGEYYVSLAYRPCWLSPCLSPYALQHFMQWGTPQDVAEYNGWSRAFRTLAEPAQPPLPPRGSMVMPMAGLGKRFADEGYAATKPLIPVSGRPMVEQAAHDLPPSRHHAFVLRRDMPGHAAISAQLAHVYPGAVISTIDAVTEGQACTALIGLDALQQAIADASGPITFAACDNGMLYDAQAFDRLLEAPDVDIIVWAARGHANAVRHPKMFGWIDAPDDRIRAISVKRTAGFSGNGSDRHRQFHVPTRAGFSAGRGHAAGSGWSGERRVLPDSTIMMPSPWLRCQVFTVDHLLSWGTPNDLRTFEYWQSCFHKWASHPYRLENDGRVPAEAVPLLARQYRKIDPPLPGPRP